MARRFAILLVVLAASAVLLDSSEQRSGLEGSKRYQRLLLLNDKERVFAYARIAPSGHYLAYTSELPDVSDPYSAVRTIHVIDLRSGRRVFSRPGFDAYWAPGGDRIIFMDTSTGLRGVSIVSVSTGTVSTEIAPASLGDYPSWGSYAGRDTILTIRARYYFLNGNRAILPASTPPPCAGIEVGERPLISPDGRRMTAFHADGTLLVRNVFNCQDIIRTGVRGGKADFSRDGNYIAFHAAKQAGQGYEIQVIDLRARTLRTVTDLPGSSFFPSWTNDGRLAFRYEGDEFRGFLMLLNPLRAQERPMPNSPAVLDILRIRDLLEAPSPELTRHRVGLLLVWSKWSAHSVEALKALDTVVGQIRAQGVQIGAATTTELATSEVEAAQTLASFSIKIPNLVVRRDILCLTGAMNQIPMFLLFRDGELVDQRLGALEASELDSWLKGSMRSGSGGREAYSVERPHSGRAHVRWLEGFGQVKRFEPKRPGIALWSFRSIAGD